MQLRLVLLGSLQYDFGQMDLTESFQEDSTVKSIVKELIDRTQFEGLKNLFTPSLDSTRALIIFVNDQDISVLRGMATPLKNNDKVTFIPVIHGG